jgi:hypothetical protein
MQKSSEHIINKEEALKQITAKSSQTEVEKTWCELTMSRLRLLFRPNGNSIDDPVRAHQEWLLRQEGYGTVKGYEPQPYEQLARALRKDGRFEDAKYITFDQLQQERRALDFGLIWLLFIFMEKCFRYGLFPGRSVMLFIASIAIGSLAFDIANYQPVKYPCFSGTPLESSRDKPVLVLHSPAVSTFIRADKDEREEEEKEPPMAMMRAPKLGPVAEYDQMVFERSCGREVDSLWYALDVFVPLLDLKQEDKCSVTMRKDGFGWRVFSNIYEIFGAIVTPIMLLSVSGLLRRYVEE